MTPKQKELPDKVTNLRRLKNKIESVVDRCDRYSDNYSPLIHTLVLASSMLLMWPRLIYLAGKALVDKLNWLGRDWIFGLMLQLVAPFIFWIAPLVVWKGDRHFKKRENEEEDY